MEVERVRNR